MEAGPSDTGSGDGGSSGGGGGGGAAAGAGRKTKTTEEIPEEKLKAKYPDWDHYAEREKKIFREAYRQVAEAEQEEQASLTKLRSAGKTIPAVLLAARGWRATLLAREEFKAVLGRGDVPPVPKLFGLDLVVRQDDPGAWDNPQACWMMIDPITGFAPSKWQSKAGPCTVVRADGGPYGSLDHEVLHDYLSMMLDVYADEGGAQRYLDPRAFQRWIRKSLAQKGIPSDEKTVLEKVGIAAPAVKLKGLKKAPQLNGRIGYRGRWLEDKQRFEIYLIDGKDVRARPDNIEVLS